MTRSWMWIVAGAVVRVLLAAFLLFASAGGGGNAVVAWTSGSAWGGQSLVIFDDGTGFVVERSGTGFHRVRLQGGSAALREILGTARGAFVRASPTTVVSTHVRDARATDYWVVEGAAAHHFHETGPSEPKLAKLRRTLESAAKTSLEADEPVDAAEIEKACESHATGASSQARAAIAAFREGASG